MKATNIVIVDLGIPGRKMKARHGNFSIAFIRAFQEMDANIRVLTITPEKATPEHFQDADGVIFTGALESAFDDLPWKKTFDSLALSLIDSSTPLLGICFGHQYISLLKGGEVINRMDHKEHGRMKITLTEEGLCDPLFIGIDEATHLYATHNDLVATLAPGSILLASSELVENHAFRIGENSWGTQAHPEFYLELMKDCLRIEYSDITELENELADAERPQAGQQLMESFVKYIESR